MSVAEAVNEKAILREIKTSRAKVEHYKQWRNEPSCKKKLGQWRRRLKKALKAAQEAGVSVPEDPFAPPPPPPPPPTAAEIHASALTAIRKRIRLDFQIQKGSTGWAPWGESGWSAITVTTPNYKWCAVKRVNPRNNEPVAKGKVLRARIISRDPEQKGRDKPSLRPDEVFEHMNDEPTAPASEDAVEAPTASEPKTPLTPEEKAAREASVAKLLGLLDDAATDEDW